MTAPASPSAAPPRRVRLSQGEDGSIHLSLPANESKMLSAFMLVFGVLPLVAGILIARGGDAGGVIPMVIGTLFLLPGLYLLLGRTHISLAADAVRWHRFFLKAWPETVLARDAVHGIGSSVTMRTNGHPSGWSLHFRLTPEAAAAPSRAPGADEGDGADGAGNAPPQRSLRERFLARDIQKLPGAFGEPTALWLGQLLGQWCGHPFDGNLDKTYMPPQRRGRRR